MIDLKNVQAEHKEWSEHNFGDAPSWQPLLGAVEELGELAHAHLKREQGIRTTENHTENIKDAIGDIVIYLMDYCSRENLDIENIIFETWDSVKQRDWKKDKDTAHLLKELNNDQHPRHDDSLHP